ncbi:MAG: hypothetical protein RI959_1180 [Pseudomonadota bacterium]
MDGSDCSWARGRQVSPVQVTQATVSLDLAGYVTAWGADAQALFGFSADEAIGQAIMFLCPAQQEVFSALDALSEGQDSAQAEVQRRTRDGTLLPVTERITLLRDAQGQAQLLQVDYFTQQLMLSEPDRMRLYVRIIEDSHQGVLVTDRHERIVMVNSAFTRITGYTPEEAIGQTPDLLRSGRHDFEFRSQVRSAMQGAGLWFGEILGRRKNGEVFPQSVSISALRNDAGEVSHAFSIFSDITSFKETEARLQRLANFDSVTGLPNRSLLNQLLAQALTFARRNHDAGAVLVVQMQRLNTVYDTLGHELADAYVAELAQRMRTALREQDVLARLSHDKFAVGLLNIPKREHAGLVAQKLLAALTPPVVLPTGTVHGSACIGISLYPENGMDASALLRCAEMATVRASEADDAVPLYFSHEMNARATERFRIESELRHALAHGELLLYHQPKVSLRNGRIVGAEALMRWQHPVHGLMPPGNFVPVAEETSLILELGEWVLHEACRQIQAWGQRGLNMPPLAVNLSARQFDKHLPRSMEALLQQYQIKPAQLKLEITESLVVRGADEVIPIMNDLVAMGFSIALDDFGTGYSSLAYLKKFPITTLKIDRAFVVGIPAEPNDCAIAQAIVTMGQQLRQEIVAEGVETRDQMTFLRQLGCDQLQGYLFSKPLPVADYERLVQEDVRLPLD